MKKIQKLKEIVANNVNLDVISKELLILFKDQIEENTYFKNLILSKEQYDLLGDEFNFSVFGNTLVSVEFDGEVDFTHFFYIENMDSIKEKGLLVSYSKDMNTYKPDLGYGIYAIQGNDAYQIDDEFVEFLLERYDGEDAEVGYVEGTYKGKYLICVHGYNHWGYLVLKNDVTLDMIENIDSEYISGLAEDYCNYLGLESCF